MATHSSILAWRISWTGRPDLLRFVGSQRVGHDWATALNWTEPIFLQDLHYLSTTLLSGFTKVLQAYITKLFVSLTNLVKLSLNTTNSLKGITEDETAGWHHWLDGCESQWTPGVSGGHGGLMCCNSWCRKELFSQQLNWTLTRLPFSYLHNSYLLYIYICRD